MPSDRDIRERRDAQRRLDEGGYGWPSRRRRPSRTPMRLLGLGLVVAAALMVVLGIEWPPDGWYGPEYPRGLTPVLLAIAGAILLVIPELER